MNLSVKTLSIRAFNKSQVPVPKKVELPRGYDRTVLEIGCGVGFHPIDYAKKNQSTLILAIEKTREKFDKFKRRIDGHPNLSNLVGIHSNAVWWVTHHLSASTLDGVFILYPNPYPKDPQKRFFRMPFMHHLIETLKDGAFIEVATNEEFYYQEVLDYGLNYWKLKLVDQFSIDRHFPPRSHFEKKYLSNNHSCRNVIFRKGDAPFGYHRISDRL